MHGGAATESDKYRGAREHKLAATINFDFPHVLVQKAIPIAHLKPALDELERLGHSRAQLFRQCGISLPARETVTLPAEEFIRFYGFVLRMLEGETSCRSDRQPYAKEVVDLMCFCVINCANLWEVVERAAAFNRALGPRGGTIKAEQHGGLTEIVVDSHRRRHDFAGLMVDLASMNLYCRLFSWLIGKRIQLTKATVMYSPPADPLLSLDFLGIPLEYSQSTNRLILPSSYMDMPVVRSYAELLQVIDYLPFESWATYGSNEEMSVSDRLRALFMGNLQRNQPLPRISAAAQFFFMSSATLCRRLREEGSSYGRLRKGCQRKYAEYLLKHTRISIQEVAIRMGFGDDRAFRRAFGKWAGDSPSDYRHRFQSGDF